jgi:hypothetical protein
VIAAWTALVHRVVATVAAGCAVAVIVVLLVSGSVGRLVLLVGLMAASTAASRVALGRAPDVAGARPVGPARRGVLLMNPRSGGGKVNRFDLVGRHTAAGSSRCCCSPATTCVHWPKKLSRTAPT